MTFKKFSKFGFFFSLLSRNYLLILLFSLQIFSGCEAPRDNPLDPANPNNAKKGTIEGTVQSFGLPYVGISGVRVFWTAGNDFVTTDNSGGFIILNVEPINGPLIFEKQGFNSDTINVVWGNSKSLSYTINLNQLPVLDSIAIYTSVINNNTNLQSQNFELSIIAQISDPDKDIDSVYVSNSLLKFNNGLEYNLTDKVYQATLSVDSLGISDLEQTIGSDFQINVIDIFKVTHYIGSGKVTRVIKNEVQLLIPDGSTTVDSIPVFNWQKFNAGYTFNYMLEVYTNDLANAQLVFRVENLPSDTLSYVTKKPLATGEYYWVVWAVDRFRNRSRSKPLVFKVQ
jgi:hypothetical protein